MSESFVCALVSTLECSGALLHDLESLGAEVLQAGDCRQARQLLKSSPQIDLVVTSLTLPDGNWCDLIKFIVDADVGASLIVTTPQADARLWSEVIWRGAYDLLVEPYERGELLRCVEGAIRAARSSRLARRANAASATA